MPTREQSLDWLTSWDRQQECSIADREERFSVIADVVAEAADRPDPLILDLGVGPGSLAVRLLARLPGAEVIGVDADALLLGLARSAYADSPGLRLVEQDLRDAGWVDALELARPLHAVVSTTALHWLTASELADVYRTVAGLLRPGGVLVNGDHLADPQPGLNNLARTVARRRAERLTEGGAERLTQGGAERLTEGGAERVAQGGTERLTQGGGQLDWAQWWQAVAEAPELAELVAARGAQPIAHDVPEPPTLADHLRLLLDAGFVEAGTVWAHGDNRVMAALR